MFRLFKRSRKPELVEPVTEELHEEEKRPDFPVNQCFLFQVQNRTFVGMCYQYTNGKAYFALPDGIFITKDDVKVIREATQKERMAIERTKREIEENRVVRILRIVDL